jgi:hypothetical protein
MQAWLPQQVHPYSHRTPLSFNPFLTLRAQLLIWLSLFAALEFIHENRSFISLITSMPKGIPLASALLSYSHTQWRIQMADLIFVVVTIIFFVISWWYVIACDRI